MQQPQRRVAQLWLASTHYILPHAYFNRELLVLVHPDKYGGDKALAAEAFRVLNGAYEALTQLLQ